MTISGDDEPAANDVARANHEAARFAHQGFATLQLEMFKSVIAFGVEAIRTSALINGGAAVASMALTGAIFQNSPVQAAHFSTVVLWFVSGVFAPGLASGFSYLSQLLYAMRLNKTKRLLDPPYLDVTGGSWFTGFGMMFHAFAIVAVIASYLALARGGWLVWRLFQAFI